LPVWGAAEEPRFQASLEYPKSTFIAPIPSDAPRLLISMAGSLYRPFKRFYETTLQVTRSDYETSSLTFGGDYYKKGNYQYSYTPRTVDAPSYMQSRRKFWLKGQLSELSSKALSKQQREKAGGLLSVNIPIKSKTFESVFGEGGAGLKVSGTHQITFSGKSQWDDRASTATYRQNKFPSLNMEQISRFDINGNIGSKITVSVSQDSKTDIPLANRLILRYKGDEDDIIKSIEAGNTNLSLPNTQFVGYSARIQGLFGVKTEAQIGNLKLTAIASQEKGTTERSSLTAGASARKDYLRDYQYANGRIFDLGRRGIDFQEGDSIQFIEIFTALSSYQQNTIGLNAKFYVDPKNPALDSAEASEALIDPDPLSESDYTVDVDEHYVIFNQANAGASYEIGAFMIVKRANGAIDTIGDISQEPYILKLIKHRNPDSSQVTWEYMWRNVYYLQSTNIDLDGLEIEIYKGASGTERNEQNLDNQDGVPYIRILGLDRDPQSGGEGIDGKVDVHSGMILPVQGLLVFPSRKPFATSQVYPPDTFRLAEQVNEIYAYTYGNQQAVTASKYYLVISNKSRASQISLGRMNIIEGSERITLNGRQLTRGTDYSIEYDFGQITFLTEEALDPNASISIDYEYSPIITSEKKTLFGIRGEYDFSDKLQFGSTFLYKSDKATERKPRIGQETARTMIVDIDGSLEVKPNFLGRIFNVLPFYSTDSKSSLKISGEIAQSYPNPNVDGDAYLDDFEGSRDSYSLGVYRELWTLASKPVGLESYRKRGRLIWYNPYDQVPTDEIWNRELKAGESGTHTLWLEYYPSQEDKRPGDKNIDSSAYNPYVAWAGIMRYMPAGSANQEEAQLLELRLNGRKGILHVDAGNISEDVNGNDSLDTEDRKTGGNIYNNILNEGEDVGLDGKPDSLEGTGPDPNGDNWYYNGEGAGCNGCGPDDYSHINGTEGNEKDPNRWGRPDTEDIYRNYALDRANSYFSFRIDLEDDRFYVDSSEFNGWRTYRIPIKDTTAIDDIVGSPSWTQINFIRLWVESPTGDSVILKIASADFIQSNWTDTLKSGDMSQTAKTAEFNVAVINNQENVNYIPPPGVTGYYDKTNAVTEPEQSLLLHYDGLVAGDTGLVERKLFEAQSLVGYRGLKMFVHGDAGVDSVLFFFRIGQDSANIYEYRTILEPGWSDNNEVDIVFEEITGIKEYLLQNRADSASAGLPYDTTVGKYRVFGKPNLDQIKYMACGVVNLDSTQRPTGDVWVDELRVVDVRRDVGTAVRITASGNAADLFTYSGGVFYRDSYFRELSSSTRGGGSNNLGSGKSEKTYNLGLNTSLDKFLPRSLGASFPFSISYSKNSSVPRLRSGTDIILPQELREKESTISSSRSFSISESFNRKTRNPLFTVLLNKWKTSYSYNRSQGTSPTVPTSYSENYNIRNRYDLSFGTIPNIKPFFWTKPIPILKRFSGNKFYLIPTSIGASGDIDRSLRISENSSRVRTETVSKNFHGTFRTSYKMSDNILLNYNMETKRDMSNPKTVNLSFNPSKLRLGRETNYNESFGASYSPNLFSFLSHKFTFGASYAEARNLSDTTGARNASAGKSYSVSGALDFGKLFGVKKKKGDGGDKKDMGPRRSELSKAAPKGGSKGSVLKPFMRAMNFLTGWLRPINYDYSEGFKYTYTGILQRAQWKFRFGLSDDVGASIDPNSRTIGASTSAAKSTSYSLNTGTTFLGGLKTDVSFSRKIDQDINKSVSPQKSVSTTFPDIRFNIGPLTTIKIFNPLIKRFSPRTGYSKSTSETINLQTGFKSSERSTVTQRPLLSFNVDIIRGIQVNVSTDRTVTESKNFNSQNGALSSRTRDITTNYSFNTKYSFSSPSGIKIPILGRFRFKSTATVSLDVSLRKQKTQSATGGASLASTGERTVLTIAPAMSYAFSSQIRGGLSANWQDTNDLALKRKSHIRELRFYVDIKF
jgi:cell surface protein SprA